MGKRSDFDRIPKEKYYTFDPRAYVPVRHIFQDIKTYIEPCAGGGDMMEHLAAMGLKCVFAGDTDPEHPQIIKASYDTISKATLKRAEYIITNPPWMRPLMHPFIQWCIDSGKPAWLLIDSNWASTKQARPYLTHCSDVVVIGRLKWIPGSKHSSVDDCAWFRFQAEPCDTIWRNVAPPVDALDDLI
tara:strand:- start:389 stop:949 length:561 start_codon:yes stop_codon:yes gene_type:complete